MHLASADFAPNPFNQRVEAVDAATAARILEIFTGLARHHLTDRHGNHVQTFHPDVTELQALVLDLLDIPHSVYTT